MRLAYGTGAAAFLPSAPFESNQIVACPQCAPGGANGSPLTGATGRAGGVGRWRVGWVGDRWSGGGSGDLALRNRVPGTVRVRAEGTALRLQATVTNVCLQYSAYLMKARRDLSDQSGNHAFRCEMFT